MLTPSSFYNAIAYEYENYCEGSLVNNFIEDDIALLKSYEPQSVLEFGIGNGRFARAYIQRNPHILYIGVDNSRSMLNMARDCGAILILEDFIDYIQQAITKEMWFDCIIAPYTAIHHVQTIRQLELFEKMKQITKVIIINCVMEKEEKEIFSNTNEAEVTFLLSGGDRVKTKIYKLHETIRVNMRQKSEGGKRENLVWTVNG